MRKSDQLSIVVADDDADDRLLIEDAFQECDLSNQRDYVEDEAHVEFLRSERCQLMQGFLIGEPVCHRSTESLLINGHQDFGVRSLQRRLEEQFPADAA